MFSRTIGLRLLHHLAFSFYLARLVILVTSRAEVLPSLLQWLNYLLAQGYRFRSYLLHRPSPHEQRTDVDVDPFVLVAGSNRLYLPPNDRSYSIYGTLVDHLAGFVIVAGSALAVLHQWEQLRMPNAPAWVLAVELVVMVSAVPLYLYRSWPTNAVWGAPAAILHFLFLGWVFGDTWSSDLIVDIGNLLIWGYYVRLKAGSPSSAKTSNG